MAGHRVGPIVIIIATAVVMVIMFGFNMLNSSEVIPGLYKHTDMEELSDKYEIDISPAGWTFSIWGAIYFWQVIFIAYGLSTICRQGPEGYLYYSPGIMPVGIYICYMCNNVLNVTWLFMFDREWMHAALAVIILLWITLIIPLIISHKALHDNLPTLQKYGMMKEAWLIRFLVQNAHAFYCTWLAVATLLNLTIVMVHLGGMEMSQGGNISLGILSAEIGLWVFLDFFILHKYTNYLFSPYVVLPIALGGSLAKNFKPWHVNTIMTVVLLGLSLVFFIIKIVLMIVRHIRNRRQAPIESTLEKKTIPA